MKKHQKHMKTTYTFFVVFKPCSKPVLKPWALFFAFRKPSKKDPDGRERKKAGQAQEADAMR